jgi:ABC-type branched-subunit amino acid transport system substrate-binding protein
VDLKGQGEFMIEKKFNLKLKYITLLLLFVYVVSGCSSRDQSASNAQKKRVVVVLPLTGGAASWGEEFMRGVTMFNEQYSNGTLDVQVVDSQSDPGKALSAVQQAYLTGKPYATVSTLSTITVPIVDYAVEENHFVICCMTSDSILRHPNHVQRIYPSAEVNASTPATYAKEKYKTIGVFYAKGEFGETVNRIFSATFISPSNQIVVSEAYDGNDPTIVRSVVAKVIRANPDAVFITGIGVAYWSFFTELRTQGYKGSILSDASFGDIQQIEKLGIAGDNVVFMAGETELTRPRTEKAKEYNEKFTARFKEPVNYTAITVFESLRILQQLATMNSDVNAMEIRKLARWDSVAGPIIFKSNGDCDYPWILVQHKNRQVLPMDPENE